MHLVIVILSSKQNKTHNKISKSESNISTLWDGGLGLRFPLESSFFFFLDLQTSAGQAWTWTFEQWKEATRAGILTAGSLKVAKRDKIMCYCTTNISQRRTDAYMTGYIWYELLKLLIQLHIHHLCHLHIQHQSNNSWAQLKNAIWCVTSANWSPVASRVSDDTCVLPSGSQS